MTGRSAGGDEASGIAPRERVFGGPPLVGQVFALEILERPLTLERRDGATVMTIDRRGCREGIFTTRGKARLVERTLATAEAIAAAQADDKQLHRWLLGAGPLAPVSLPHAGLRWASGGVLSVVKWRGETWTPFFFRDIPPFGWNISLGGSDRNDDLSHVEGFIEREFLEETLVVSGAPSPGHPVAFRRLVFAGRERAGERGRAERLAGPHIARRHARDGLRIDLDGGDIAVESARTRMRAVIVADDGVCELSNVLVCVNRLEAALEVVKAVRYDMADGDTMLDGELLEPVGSQSPADLIRMPVAMISHNYLRKAFGPAWHDYEYAGVLQPSVEGPPMGEGDIVVFDHDLVRRREIWSGAEAATTPFERERYEDWMQRFGDNFYDRNGRPSMHRPATLFTLPAAKIVSYYFAHGD